MATLEDKIKELEEEIAEYRIKLRAATTDAGEERYANLITATRNEITAKETRLNTLLQQQTQAQPGGGQELFNEAVGIAVHKVLKIVQRIHTSAPLMSPSVYSQKVLEQFGILDLKDIPHIKDAYDLNGVGDVMTFPEGPFINEYDLNCQYYDELAQVFGSERLFNTETNAYIPASDNAIHDKKPDWLIFECASFLDEKPKPLTYSRDEICYAVPPAEVLEFVTAILEAKTGKGDLNMTELEPLFTYLALLVKEKHPNPRGLLYNQSGFIYAVFSLAEGGLTTIAKSSWTFPGCKQFLQSQFSPNSVLATLKRVVPFTLGRFLGKGRYGFVVEASNANEESFALKFVTSHFDMFEQEFAKLCEANETAPDVVIQPTKDSFVINTECGLAYYRMDEIGIPKVPDLLIRSAFVLLCSLHSKGIVHGDPRIQNIVQVNEKLKWVDMRYMHGESVSIESDMRCIIQSCFECTEVTLGEHSAILQKLGVYVNDVSMDNVNALYEVCKDFLYARYC